MTIPRTILAQKKRKVPIVVAARKIGTAACE